MSEGHDPREVLRRHRISPITDLGQHFLVNRRAVERFVGALDLEGDEFVVEVGAGTGVLTRPIAKRARFVVAVELDGRLCKALEEELSDLRNVRVVHGDFLRLPLEEIAPEEQEVVLAGNLPFGISSQVLAKVVHEHAKVRRAVLTFQREVADRILARPGSRQYCSLSVLVRLLFEVRKVCNFPPHFFHPRPEVTSTVLRFEGLPRPREEVPDLGLFERVVRAAFSSRRKTLENALSGAMPELGGKGRVRALLRGCGVDPLRRAEQMSLREFARIARAVSEFFEVEKNSAVVFPPSVESKIKRTEPTAPPADEKDG